MTKNNKVVLGVAAGVAALAVAGMYAKKKGYLDNVNTSNLKDKLNGLKDSAMKAFGNSNNADASAGNGNSMDNFASTNGSTIKRKSTSTLTPGSAGNINPATV